MPCLPLNRVTLLSAHTSIYTTRQATRISSHVTRLFLKTSSASHPSSASAAFLPRARPTRVIDFSRSFSTTSRGRLSAVTNMYTPVPAAGPATSPTISVATKLIPVIRDLKDLRRWRKRTRETGRSVGVVPTMGALHDGHLNLVQHSMSDNPSTIMTLFVNPTQFAPHEDLSSYPRTLERDLELLSSIIPEAYKDDVKSRIGSDDDHQPSTSARQPVAALNIEEILEAPLIVFAPERKTMYPLSEVDGPESEEGKGGEGMLQDTSKQRGAFVEVKGWGNVLEGRSRPQFFQGVATVCTKLFNAVEPDHAYFGQKDIQQALLLKIMLKDLLMTSPSPSNLHIVPTSRDPVDSLALSSRNAYLTAEERPYAGTLYRALESARSAFRTAQEEGKEITGREMVEIAEEVVADQVRRIEEEADEDKKKVQIKLDYIEIFDRDSFQPIRGGLLSDGPSSSSQVRKSVICGAMWLGRTRLIDNLLIGWDVDADVDADADDV